MLRCFEQPAAHRVGAAVNGVAAGGGVNLALMCDYRIASRTAKFSQAFVKIGMHPDWGGAYLLPRIVGMARAIELMTTGRAVDADEALSISMVTRVVEPAELADQARTFATSLAELPPLAIAEIKRSVYSSLDLELDEVLEREIEVQLRLFQTRDAREGMEAFRAKRPPRFTGE